MRGGLGIFCVSHASGKVELYDSESGLLLVTVGAHSRQINALVAHPKFAIFATCSDDTYVNLWEVSRPNDQ